MEETTWVTADGAVVLYKRLKPSLKVWVGEVPSFHLFYELEKKTPAACTAIHHQREI